MPVCVGWRFDDWFGMERSCCHDYCMSNLILLMFEQEAVWVAFAYEQHSSGDLSRFAKIWGKNPYI